MEFGKDRPVLEPFDNSCLDNVLDLVFINENIWLVPSSHADEAPVVIFDPPLDVFIIGQFHQHGNFVLDKPGEIVNLSISLLFNAR